MSVLGLEFVDFLMVAIYLVGITVLGVRMGKTVKGSEDFFVGGRRFGKVMGIFSVFGSGTHADQAVGVVAKTYTDGMSGIWYQWNNLFVTPFNWWIAPIMRRCRAITTGDYFEARYDRGVATLYVVVGMLIMVVSIGLMLKGAGAVIGAATGDAISQNKAIALMTVVFVVYNVVGGLAAAIVTDFVQGCLTVLFSFILMPFALYRLGGFSGLHDAVARSVEIARQQNPGRSIPDAQALWSLVAPGEIGLFYIVMIVLVALIGIVTQPHVMPISGAVKTEWESQIGSVYGSLMKRVCTIAWTFMGMCAIAFYPGLTEKKAIDATFGRLAHDLLPDAMPGLIGIFVASLLASIMAGCGAFMLTCSALFTQNVYRPFIAPRATQAHYVNIGRVAASVTVAAGVLYAFWLDSVVRGIELFLTVSALMGIAFWAGLFWRRATAAGAWASTLVSSGVFLLTEQSWFVDWARTHATFLLFRADSAKIYLPVQMLMYLAAGLVTMIAVSLLTRRTDQERLDRFYETLRTPVEPREKIPSPVRLPEGRLPAPQRKLINHPDWEIQRPTRRGLVGFLIAWVLVISLIGLVWVLVRIGA